MKGEEEKSTKFCALKELSLFIFRVKKLVMHSERFMKNRSAINYTSSYKLLSSLSSSIIIMFPRSAMSAIYTMFALRFIYAEGFFLAIFSFCMVNLLTVLLSHTLLFQE